MQRKEVNNTWEELLSLISAIIGFLFALYKVVSLVVDGNKHLINSNDMLTTKVIHFAELKFGMDLDGDKKIG